MSYRDKKADVLYADTQLPCCLQEQCSVYNPEAIKPGPTLTPVSVVVALELLCKKCKSVFCEACFESHTCTTRKKGTYSFDQLQAAAERAAPPGAPGRAARKQHSQQHRPSLISSGTHLECSPVPDQAAAAAWQGPGRPQSGRGRRSTSSQPAGKSGKQQRALLPAAAALAQSGTCKLYDVGAQTKKAQHVHGRAPKDSDKCPDFTSAFYPSSTWMQQLGSELSNEEKERQVYLPRTRRHCANEVADGSAAVASLADAAAAAGAAVWEAAPDSAGGDTKWVVWSGRHKERQHLQQARQQQQQGSRLTSGTAAAIFAELFTGRFGCPPPVDGPADLKAQLHKQQQQRARVAEQHQQVLPGRKLSRQGSRKQKGGGQKRQRQHAQDQEQQQQRRQVVCTPGQGHHLHQQQKGFKQQRQQQQAVTASGQKTHVQVQQQQQLEKHCSSEPEQSRADSERLQQQQLLQRQCDPPQHEEQRCSNEPEQQPNNEQQQQQLQQQPGHEWGKNATPFANPAVCTNVLLGGDTQAAALGQHSGSMGVMRQPATAAAGDKQPAEDGAPAATAVTDLAPLSKSAPPGFELAAVAAAAAQTAGATVAAAGMRAVASADVGVVAAAAAAAASAVPVRYPDTERMQCLRGYVPEMPPVAPGEVRALGQTMHPAVAERYKQVCDDFWAEVAAKVSAMQSPMKPTRAAAKASRSSSDSSQQLLGLHVSLDPSWIQPTVEGSMSQWCKAVGIDGDKLLRTLVDLINAGLSAEGGAASLGSAVQLPQMLPCRFIEPYTVPQDHPVAMLRGQKSVRAAEDILKGTILGAYQGYMLFEQGFSELKLRAKPSHFTSGQRACDRACAPLLWEMQTESYAAQDDNMQVPCSKKPHEQQPGRPGKGCSKHQAKGASTAAAAAAEQNRDMLWCSAFGYGNMTALVNDPSMDPLSVCYDDAAYAERDLIAQPNVVIRVLWVRNWPFLFMITDRDVKKGEDFWYDYTAPYWRIIHETLERIAQITGMSPSQAFEAAVKLGNGQGSDVARLLSGLQDEEAPTQTVSVPLSGASAARRYAEAAEGIPPQGSSAAAMAAAMAAAGDGSGQGSGAAAHDAAAAAADKEQDSAPAAADDAARKGGRLLQQQEDMHGDSCSEGADVSGPAAITHASEDEPPMATADTGGAVGSKRKSSKASSGSKQDDLQQSVAHPAAASGRKQQQERSKQYVSTAASDGTGSLGKNRHNSEDPKKSRRSQADIGQGQQRSRHRGRSRSRSTERCRGRSRSSSRGRLGRLQRLDETQVWQGSNTGKSPESRQRKSSAAGVAHEPAPKRGRFLTLPPAGVKPAPHQQQNTLRSSGGIGYASRQGAAAADGVGVRGTGRPAAAAPARARAGRRRSRSRSRSRSPNSSRSRDRQPLQQQQQRGQQPVAGRPTFRSEPGAPRGYGACRSPVRGGPGHRTAAPPTLHVPQVGEGRVRYGQIDAGRSGRPGADMRDGSAGHMAANHTGQSAGKAAAIGQRGPFGGSPVLAQELQQQESIHFAFPDAGAAASKPALNRDWGIAGAQQRDQQGGAGLQPRRPSGARPVPGPDNRLINAQPGRPGPDRGPDLLRGQQPEHDSKAPADLQPGRLGPDSSRQGPSSSAARPPRQVLSGPAAAAAAPTKEGPAVVLRDVPRERAKPAAAAGGMQAQQWQQLVQGAPTAAAAKASNGVAGAAAGGIAAGHGAGTAAGQSKQQQQPPGAAAVADVINLVDSPKDAAAQVSRLQQIASAAAAAAAGSMNHLAAAVAITPAAAMTTAPVAGSGDPVATASVAPAVVAAGGAATAGLFGVLNPAGFETLPRPTGNKVLVFSDDEADSDSDSDD